MNTKQKQILRCAVAAAIALMLAIGVALSRGLAWPQPAMLMCRYLSDGFFVSGLLFAGFGALVWISTTGFFDIFSYGFHSLLVLFTSLRKPQEHEKYHEYKAMKEEKRGKPLHFIWVTGVICLALSLLCLMLYYNLPA